MILLLPITAFSAPVFEADEPSDALLAARAWSAAVACTGRDPEAAATVALTRSVIPGGWLGRAHVDDAHRLTRIDVSAPEARVGEVIVHEVAHAWVSDGDHALVEGAAELLADCIVRREPGLAALQFDDGRALVTMTDLRAWEIAAEGRPLAMDGARTEAYLGAARLLRTAADVIGEQTLWTAGPLTWERLEATLANAGDPGATILAVVQANTGEQQRALADDDRDGLTDLAEALRGTDPSRFDSDGDGWWDGAEARPARALRVPLDGTPACVGSASAGAVARPGGNLRGLTVPRLHSAHLPSGAVLLSLRGENLGTSGGMWADLDAWSEHPRCASDLRRTVVDASGRHEAVVAPFASALDAALDAAEARLGPSPTRVAVLLGGDESQFDGQVLRLSDAEVEAAVAAGALPELAATAAALPRVWWSGERSWRDAVALGRSLR
jgi:hypothetical protein